VFWFVLSIIFFLATAGLLAVGLLGGASTKFGFISGAAGCCLLAILLLFFACFREVPTKSIGVPTSFGKVESALGPGIHLKAPWVRVNIITGTIQTTTFEGSSCLDVRIGGQQTACLDVTIQWRVSDQGAPALFNNYANPGESIMTEITDAVVIRELKLVENQVLGDYQPIQDVQQNVGASQFSTFGPIVESRMRSDLAGKVTVVNVLMPLLRYDAATQQRLNQIQAQIADTAIAQQQYNTNVAQAKANSALARSVSTSPAVLIAQCLQIAQQALKSGESVQPGYCFGIGGNPAIALKG
jgi:regulator of protease activity HflC (stomatin/prohibitin superfamily)